MSKRLTRETLIRTGLAKKLASKARGTGRRARKTKGLICSGQDGAGKEY